MKKKLKIIFTLLVITIFSIAITLQHGSNTLTVSEFYERTNVPNVQLVDIRTSEEFKTGHIKNAVNIDFYSDNFEESFIDFNTEKPLYLYCKTGNISLRAIPILKNRNFKLVYDLKGGITSWKEEGYKIITEEVNVNIHLK